MRHAFGTFSLSEGKGATKLDQIDHRKETIHARREAV
jgi:hypothetical protein